MATLKPNKTKIEDTVVGAYQKIEDTVVLEIASRHRIAQIMY